MLFVLACTDEKNDDKPVMATPSDIVGGITTDDLNESDGNSLDAGDETEPTSEEETTEPIIEETTEEPTPEPTEVPTEKPTQKPTGNPTPNPKEIIFTYGDEGPINYEDVYDENGYKVMTIGYNTDRSIRNLTEYDIYGRVVRAQGYGKKYSGMDPPDYFSYGYEYDKYGNRVKEINYYSSDGSPSSWTEYEYNANGKMIKSTDYRADGSLINWCELTYHTNGRLKKSVKYNADGSLYRWDEEDENGLTIKQIRYYSDGRFDEWIEFERDANGNWTKQTEYNADGSIWQWEEQIYDENGRCIKTAHYNAAGYSAHWSEHEYDANGKLIKTIHHDWGETRVEIYE